MRITDLGLFSGEIELASFSLLKESTRSTYMVRKITGLDAEEITPKFYAFGKTTGKRFYDFGLRARDIVMNIILNPNFGFSESYSDLRDNLYSGIAAQRSGLVTLRFNSGGATVSQLNGFVTKIEVDYFDNKPAMQMTFRCDDPMFRGLAPVKLVGAEIPPPNPLYIPDSQSSAPHGVLLNFTVTAAVNSLILQDAAANPDWVFEVFPNPTVGTFAVNPQFAVGDKIVLSSEYSDKYVYMIRGGVTSYLSDKITVGSIWPVIFPGQNALYLGTPAAFTVDQIMYYPAYWGI